MKMKKRFLATLCVVAMSLVNCFYAPTTPVKATEQLSEEMIQQIKELNSAELVELLDYLHSVTPDYRPDEDGHNRGSILNNNGSFLTGDRVVYDYTFGRGWVLWLNPGEEEVLRQRFPERLESIPSPIALNAGEDSFSPVPNYEQVEHVPGTDVEAYEMMPDFDKIVKILERGPYDASISAKVTKQPTGNIKVGKQYTIEMEYEITTTDGGDYTLGDADLWLEQDLSKPTEMLATMNCVSYSGTGRVKQKINLKVPKKLKKQFKAGKIIVSSPNGVGTTTSLFLQNSSNSSAKTGKIKVTFKYKKVKS